ncbi:MAG: hypothetical protein JSS35_01890 [Proteobacteria bacterium]|nr:hypothetical protein [Pseudomonadota bacterium]
MSEARLDPNAHPSPRRGKVGLARLLYGLMAGPLAWALSQMANGAVGQEACFPGVEPLAAPAFGGAHAIQAVILAVALLVSGSGALVSWVAWRATRDEQAGDQHALLAVGEGRSRFMAFAGLLTSVGFVLASIFSIPAMLFVPAC